MIIWIIIPIFNRSYTWNISLIIFLSILRIGVYPILLTGWASNRNYATLGSLRGVAQTISYEIRLGLLIIIFISLKSRFDFFQISLSWRVILLSFPSLILLWIVSTIAESNRTPFDFAEGERELVSGFNVEYASVGFVLIFLREYAILVLFRRLRIRLFFRINIYNFLGGSLSLIFIRIWIIIRGTLPRFRYDLLINLAWKRFLPITLGLLRLIILY